VRTSTLISNEERNFPTQASGEVHTVLLSGSSGI